jgi:hypothetical protein
MSSRHKLPASTARMNAATPRKRPLSRNAPTRVAKRPSTRGPLQQSSDEDGEGDYEVANNDSPVSSESVDQQTVYTRKTPVSSQDTPQKQSDQNPFQPKKINQGRLQAFLGKNKKANQATVKALPSSPAQQPLQRSMGLAVQPGRPTLPTNLQENLVLRDSNEKANPPRNSGGVLSGENETHAIGRQNTISHTRDKMFKTTEVNPSFAQRTRPITVEEPLNRPVPELEPKSRPTHVAIPTVATKNPRLQQRIISDNSLVPKVTSSIKIQDQSLHPQVSSEKRKGPRQFFPALISSTSQASTKPCLPESRNVAVQGQGASPGVLPISIRQNSADREPRKFQPQHQLQNSDSTPRRKASEVSDHSVRFSKLASSPPKELLLNIETDNVSCQFNGIAVTSPERSKGLFVNTEMSSEFGQENSDNTDTTAVASTTASVATAYKESPLVDHAETPDAEENIRSKVLVLSHPSDISKEAQTYFEYSIFKKDWSSEQDEKQALICEITIRPFTNIHDANAQAERLFQNKKYHPSYMTIECSRKQDEHGCMVLTSSIAPFEYPANKHHTKIYVQRDYVSKYANQKSQSIKGTLFISDTGYILRLFKLIKISDTDDSGSDSDNSSGVAGRKIRVYCPHGRPEVYTTLQAANRAAKNLQIELSHEKNPTDLMTKAFQERNLKQLNDKVLALEAAGESGEGCWRSKFNARGLGGDHLELMVEKAGISGPRNI